MIAKLYQMRANDENHNKLFASIQELGDAKINLEDYDLVGNLILEDFTEAFGEDINNILEGIFMYGNSSEQFYQQNPNARSISMSDIIEINGDFYYVDRFGFANVNEKIENKKVEEAVEIVNKDEETYDRLYMVYVYPGAGAEYYRYKVKALNEAHALEVLSAYLLKEAPGFVTLASEVEDVEDAMENSIYVDGTLEGADEPVYFDINTRVEDITDEPLTEALADYTDKISIAYMSKIFTKMRENGWDGNHETADKYFDDIMRQIDPNFKETEPAKEEEPLREAENDEILLPSQENPEETREFINGYLDYMYHKKTKIGLEENKKLEEDENHTMEAEETVETDIEEKSILDYIQERIGQEITIGEFNTIMQSIFGKYNEIFLQVSEIYNQDPGEYHEVTLWDDDDMYVVTYKIVDEMEPTIEITDVELQ